MKPAFVSIYMYYYYYYCYYYCYYHYHGVSGEKAGKSSQRARNNEGPFLTKECRS